MFSELTLAQKIGQLLVVGVLGTSPLDDEIQKMGDHVAQGLAGGVIYYGYNVEHPQQFKDLTQYFSGKTGPEMPLLLQTADVEGGKVNRFPPSKGFEEFHIPSAEDVGKGTVSAALELYRVLGRSLKNLGINLNLAPCVDVNPKEDYVCPVIGGFGRSYGSDEEIVTAYGSAMVQGLSESGCACCLKHYPGHGSAKKDTHRGFVDLSDVWSDRELRPFEDLSYKHPTALVMTAHVLNKQLDRDNVITFSATAIGKIRETTGEAVVITDDLMMGALRDLCGDDLEEIIIQAFQAGHDLFILSGNKKAYPNHSLIDVDLPLLFQSAIHKGISEGRITEEQIDDRFRRVMALKQRLRTFDEDA